MPVLDNELWHCEQFSDQIYNSLTWQLWLKEQIAINIPRLQRGYYSNVVTISGPRAFSAMSMKPETVLGHRSSVDGLQLIYLSLLKNIFHAFYDAQFGMMGKPHFYSHQTRIFHWMRRAQGLRVLLMSATTQLSRSILLHKVLSSAVLWSSLCTLCFHTQYDVGGQQFNQAPLMS